jgi:putative nucleotidyltransferase with HDIG domain
MVERRVLLYAEPGAEIDGLGSLLETLGVKVVSSAPRGRSAKAVSRTGDVDIAVFLFRALGEAESRILKAAAAGASGSAVVIAAPLADFREGLRLIQGGRADHVLAPGDLAGVYGAVRGLLGRLDLRDRGLACLREVRRLKNERGRFLEETRRLEEVYDATVENLMTALDLRDVETFGHSQTVAKFSEVLAGILGIHDGDRLSHIRMGALLHDIGKIAIPDSILKKPGPLSPEEWKKIKLHPVLGFGLIKEIKLVPEVGQIVLCHHERFDGTGYPKGLARDRIPVEARIFALADALDALTAHRPYRKARDGRAARSEILANRGTQFDPRVVEAFASIEAEYWERIRFETTSRLPPIEEFSRLLRSVKS